MDISNEDMRSLEIAMVVFGFFSVICISTICCCFGMYQVLKNRGQLAKPKEPQPKESELAVRNYNSARSTNPLSPYSSQGSSPQSTSPQHVHFKPRSYKPSSGPSQSPSASPEQFHESQFTPRNGDMSEINNLRDVTDINIKI